MINIDSLIKYTERDVYTPSDDTYLLLNYLNNNVSSQDIDGLPLNEINNILDMGTGTGIVAIFFQQLKENLSTFNPHIYASDISKKAIECAKRNEQRYTYEDSITYINSDLFEAFPQHLRHKFDMITFNPPYLPSFEFCLSTRAKKEDLVWDGGEKGYELFLRFIDTVRDYLAPHKRSCVYYIISSRANLKEFYENLKEKNFKNKIIDKVHIFFEDIILSRLTPL